MLLTRACRVLRRRARSTTIGAIDAFPEPQHPRSGSEATRRQLDLIVLFGFVATGMLVGAIPRYLDGELAATRSLTGVATTGFFVCALVLRPVIGPRLDRYGRARFLRWSLVALAGSSILLVGANTVWSVFVVRFLQGAFGSAFYTSALTVTADLAPVDRRAAAVARLSVMVYIGFIIGPVFVDLLLEASGFAACWYSVVVLYALSALLAFRFPETRPVVAANDRTETPIALSRIRRIFHPAARWPGMATLMVALTHSAITTFTPDYAQNMKIERPGVLLAAYAVAVLVTRVVSGSYSDRYSAVVVLLPGCLLAVGGLALLALAVAPWMSFVGVIVTGTGAGAIFPALSVLVVGRVNDSERGAALAAFLMFNDVGQAASGPIVGAWSDAFGWRWVFGLPAILFNLSFFAVWMLRRQQREHEALAVPVPIG